MHQHNTLMTWIIIIILWEDTSTKATDGTRDVSLAIEIIRHNTVQLDFGMSISNLYTHLKTAKTIHSPTNPFYNETQPSPAFSRRRSEHTDQSVKQKPALLRATTTHKRYFTWCHCKLYLLIIFHLSLISFFYFFIFCSLSLLAKTYMQSSYLSIHLIA